ncbi:energy transducer TonB [Winogradskyella luteola]|uniref:Energy transducer TonB n=1 Tax=Winogradskyella luteola TaxID=2828330 RepID=A0A9X1FAU9_9FLAO|nr:energy transducer TonB [Winogradskyella luteola]MBV7269758.1 energy transducer TonB [Winogradskyella luteola]
MKNSKKTFSGVGQNTTEVKKSQKHDANLQKNSTLYFQIGLILCLLGTYALFEMQFQDSKIVVDSLTVEEVATIDVAPDYRVKVEQKNEPKSKVERSNKIIDKVKEVSNETKIVEKELFTPDSSDQPSEPANPGDFSENNDPVDDEVFVPFPLIEKVPVYPGCEKYDSNEARKECMSKKITKLVGRKFNTSVGERYGITGLQKIQTQFTVDKNGNVTDVKVRAPHPALEKEAKRVIDKIPHMKPGIQKDKPVGVIYTLPITFQVNN